MKNLKSLLAWTISGLALTAIQSLAQSTYEPYTFTTLAGNTGYGSVDGTGSDARFASPSGVAVDSTGNVYVADLGNRTIRKVTPAGVVTTLAGLAGYRGSADGTGTAARFSSEYGVAVDSAGNVYVADRNNNTIRKLTPTGVVTTLAGMAVVSSGSADGTGSDARFDQPRGVAVDNMGNVYVADIGNNTIRKVTPTGVVTTLAGLAGSAGSADGTGNAARFRGPSAVAVDSTGNVYVADIGNYTIRKVTPTGVVTTLAGLAGSAGSADGTGNAARFGGPFNRGPSGVAVDNAGNVYVADTGNNTIRKVTPAGVVTTRADETGTTAQFYLPTGVAVDSAGSVYVTARGNNTIQKLTPAGVVTTLAGLADGGAGRADGTGSAARFYLPTGVAVESTGNVHVADSGNRTIRKVTPTGVVTTLAGLAGSGGSADGTGSAARFGSAFDAGGPSGVAVDSAGNVYVADSDNYTIRKVTPVGMVTTLAGLAGRPGSTDGAGSAARFGGLFGPGPSGMAVDSAGNIYVADTGNNTIRKVTQAGVVTTLAGLADCVQLGEEFGDCRGGSADGTGSDARFDGPSGVAVDTAGNVYVADSCNHTIRKVTPGGVVTTLAGLAGYRGSTDGTGSATRFNYPSGVAVDSAANVYVADYLNNTIRKVTPAGVVTTLAGLAPQYDTTANVIAEGYGSADRMGSDARFYGPSGVAVDSAGNVYVADSGNSTIRKGYPENVPAVIVTSGLGFGFSGGQFGFNLSGQTGRLVVVEASTDLVSWLPLWTNTFAVTLNFNDPQSGVYSNRFYRARLP